MNISLAAWAVAVQLETHSTRVNSALFGELLDVREHAHVNAVDEPIAPDCPIGFGADIERVPGAAGEAGAAVGEFGELEFAVRRPKCQVEVGGWMLR